MKRLLLFLLLASPLFGQNQTTVTGTLVDPNGIAYYPATVIACLSPVTLNPKVAGNAINLNQGANYCIGPVNTTRSGFFQMALYTNASIVPAATTWIFTVAAAGTPPPGGNGPLNFSSAGITISGTSQDVSANINSVGPAQSPSSATATNATNLVGPGTITGNYTGNGSLALTGTLNPKFVAAEEYASAFAGADCGLKIAAAVTALPANGGVVNVNQACGTGTATSPWTAVTLPGFVTLRFVEPGVYWISGITQSTVGGNFSSSIFGLPCSKTSGGNPQQCPVELHMGNGLNSPFVIKMGTANGALRDIAIDGNASNNPTGGVGVLVSGGSVDISNVTIQNNPTHGLEFAGVGTTHSADGARVKSVWILKNNADGVYALNAGDLQWGEGSQSLNNGTSATVNTTSTTITATSGSWSTDSSLVGTMVRVNNSGMCQILAVPSTTTFTVAATTCWNASGVPTALGVQTGVPLVFGNAWEANNSPTTRFGHGELSTSKMDDFLGYGTSAGFGSHRQIFTGSIQFGNAGNHDIEIIGSCLDTQTVLCAVGHTIVGNNFIGSQQRTASAGTYDFIKLVDLTNSDISGNTFTASGGGNQEKAAVEQVESAASRVSGPTAIGVNQIVGSLFTSPYIDNTVNGTFGVQFPVHAGLNSSLDLFNAAPGATNPHKYITTASDGSLRIVNNAFSTVLFQLNDSGAAFFQGGTVQAIGNPMQASGFLPNAAGGSDLGSASLPHANLWLGTAATNNFKIQPATTTGARTLAIPDWGANGSSTQNQPFVITLTSQYTNSTTTFSNVAGGNTIQFAVAANSNYTATCHLYYQAAATGGLNIEFTGPASPTAVRYGMDLPTAVTGVASGEADAFGTSIGAVSTAGAVNLDAMVSFSLLNGANAGTVNLLAKSSAAVQLQVQSGSYCQIQ